MPSEVISCPACREQVRIPESLLGQAVRCPECKVYFRAPTRDAEGHLGNSELMSGPPALALRASSRQRPPISRAPTFLPSLFLLLTAIAGLGVNGFQVTQAFVDRDTAKENMARTLKMVSDLTKQEIKKDLDEAIDQQKVILLACAGCNLISLIGAIAMMRMRFWGLAVFSSILAMINIGNCCCLMGLPSGIFALVKLFDPDTRALFSLPVDSSSGMDQL